MNTLINFELAKLLKEKGFDKYCHSGYTEKSNVYLHQGGQEPVKNGHSYYEGRNYNGGEFYCSAPTIAEVVMWLYEKYSIWIRVTPIPYSDNLTHWRWEHISTNYSTRSLKWKKEQDYISLTEAYTAAIEYVLTKLI